MTNDQLAALRAGHIKTDSITDLIADLVTHIDAQQARIAELEAKAGIGSEWRRAYEDVLASLNNARERIAEADANNTALLYLLAQIREACGDNGKCMQDELVVYIGELAKDAARYRWLMANYARGDGWQQIDDALNYGEADTKLSPAIDAAMQPTWPEDTIDYGGRIAVIGQNGNDGISYKEQK